MSERQASPLPKEEGHPERQYTQNDRGVNPEPGTSDTAAIGTMETAHQAGNGEPPSEVRQLPDRMRVKVKDNAHQEIWFEVRRKTSLGLLMKEYCKALRLDQTRLRFFYDGERVLDESTPELVRAT